MDPTEIDKSPDRIRRMFDTIAPRYDLINRILSLGIDRSWRTWTARKLLQTQKADGDVLDVCCGSGDLSLALMKQQQKTGRKKDIYGIDFSPEMIQIAQKKAQRFSSTSGSMPFFAVGDAIQLPFEANRFAIVTVAFGLRNISDAQSGLKEMIRVCKPLGTIALLDFSMPTLPIWQSFYQFYLRSILPRIGQSLAKNKDQAYNYFAESITQFDQPEQLADRLRSLGVEDVQIKTMSLGIVTLTWGKKCP